MKRKIYKEDIKQAGLDLMFLHGYNGTAIKDITQQVAIPKGSFYNHFSSKEEFALEVVQDYCENGVKMYTNSFVLAKGTPSERIGSFVDRLVKNYADQKEFKLGCIMSNFSAEMSDVNENFRTLLDEQFMACEKVMAQCITEGIETGEFKSSVDVNRSASFMLNSLHGAFIRMKTTGNEAPLLDFKYNMLSLLKA